MEHQLQIAPALGEREVFPHIAWVFSKRLNFSDGCP
jgi:hypothetical protein